MIFDGLFRNEHLFRDFLILVALSDQNNDFALALAQLSPLTSRLSVAGSMRGRKIGG